jgi:hypothetical protein
MSLAARITTADDFSALDARSPRECFALREVFSR